MRFIWHKLNLFFKILLIVFVVMAVYIGNTVFFPQSIPNGQYQLIVNKNQSMFDLATTLKQQKIIKSRRTFLILLRLLKKDKKVTAGLYLLKHPISTWGLIWRITNGKPDKISIMFSDGWTFTQLRNYVDSIIEIKHITTAMSESDLKSALKIETPNLEGLFYPATYFIAPGQTDLEIYQNAYKIMQSKLSAIYAKRSTNTIYTSEYQLLIMASLIEKETNNVHDMYLVSTVFNNRIRSGMKLQDDPSVFYGLRQQNNKSTHSRFQINTPYNTYLHYGLPPTPICIPSGDALLAASMPQNNPNLYYFVAIGAGKTKFSNTYDEHLNAVNRYIKKPQPSKPQPSAGGSGKTPNNQTSTNKKIKNSNNAKVKNK